MITTFFTALLGGAIGGVAVMGVLVIWGVHNDRKSGVPAKGAPR
jgi:hypothetical protein